MTPASATAPPRAARGIADNLRALRLLVLGALVLDAASTFRDLRVAEAGWAGAAVTTLQLVLVPAAAAALMWLRPRLAAVLCTAVLGLALAHRPTSEELWLLLVITVTVAARARPRVVAAVAVLLAGYVVGFGLRVDRRFPGEGVRTAVVAGVFCALGYACGLVVRRVLRAGERRRVRLADLERENAEIRATERRRLADDLQTVVTGGLATIQAEQRALADVAADGAALRRGLDRIDRASRAVLGELRALLEVLRRDVPASGVEEPPRRRRLLDVVTARSVRLAATAAFALLAVRALLGWDGSLLDPRLGVQVLGWVAAAVAVGAPRVGAALAVVALAVSIGSGTPTDWDALPLVVLFFLGAVRAGLRRLWLVVLAFVAYGVLLAATDPAWADRLLVASYAAAVAIVGGLAVGHFVEVDRASARRQAGLLEDRERLESEERSAVARDLHDVVAHQLTLTTLMIMSTSASTDPAVLEGTVRKVAECVENTDAELFELLHAMRGTETDEVEPSPLVLPSRGADAIAQRLSASGFAPEVTADRDADALDATTQRTLGRIMQEATTNIVRYAPAGARCRYDLAVTAEQVRLTVASPLPLREGANAFSLGWGLRGIAERVELSRGSFSAGPRRGEWFVDVTLPRAGERDTVPAPAV